MSTKRPDETDLEILRLLAENARRPYCDIAEHVNLSAPAVSDRVSGLVELGIIRRFTLDIDRSQLHDATPILVRLEPELAAVDALQRALIEAKDVEHVFTTADAAIVFSATPPNANVGEWLQGTVEIEDVRRYDVHLLSAFDWSVNIAGTDFALTCAECGNRVGNDGTAKRVGGDLQQFCCSSCETTFTARYERHRAKAEA